MNEEVQNKLDSLLPNELEEIKTFIEKLLDSFGLTRNTNKMYQILNKNVKCPKCENINIVKNGHKNNTQRYKCKNCNAFFSITTNSILSYSRLTYNQLTKMIQCLIEKYSLEKTSQIVGITIRETYTIRIKIISLLNQLNKDIILKEIVQADEKYIRISFKGTRKNKMPRKSRRNGKQSTRGLGDEQVCIVGAIDSNDNIILKIVGTGQASTEMIKNGLYGKIEKNSILVTDSKSAYIKFAEDNSLILKQIPRNRHKVEEIYHLGELNSLFSELEIFLQNFRGLSTRHLQEYLGWFRYNKFLRYTLELMNQNYNLYKFVIKQDTKLTARKVCKTKMPIDIQNIYNIHFD